MPYILELPAPKAKAITQHDARSLYRAAKSGGQDVPRCLLGMAFKVADSELATRRLIGPQLREALKGLQVGSLPYRVAPKVAEATEVSCRIDGVEVPEVGLVLPRRIGPTPFRKILYAAGTLAGAAAGLYLGTSDAVFNLVASVAGQDAGGSLVVALGVLFAAAWANAMAGLWKYDTEKNLLLLAAAAEAAILRALANFLKGKGGYAT